MVLFQVYKTVAQGLKLVCHFIYDEAGDTRETSFFYIIRETVSLRLSSHHCSPIRSSFHSGFTAGRGNHRAALVCMVYEFVTLFGQYEGFLQLGRLQ